MRTAFMVAFASWLEVICIAPGCLSVVNHTEIIFTCAFPIVSFVLSSAAAQKCEVGLILGKLFHRIVEPFRTQVRLSRNPKRFPADFMFQLNREETQALLLQNARAKGRGGRWTPPYAFAEQGVAMLSSVLNSDRAIEVNIAIMRAFVRLRAMLATHADLARRLTELEQKY